MVQNFEKPIKTIPGNSSYADLTRRGGGGGKICMFGDSLLQPISMEEFNSYLDNNIQATRVSFPGAMSLYETDH